MATITNGAITTVLANSGSQSDFHPIVQVVSVKKMNPAGASNDRYRLILSDGEHFTQSMLATQQNSIITEGHLKEGCLIRLEEFIVNLVQGKKLIIVLTLEVVSGAQPKIGAPKPAPMNDPSSENGSGPPPRQQQHYNSTGPYGNSSMDVKPQVSYGGGRANNPYGSNSGGGGNSSAGRAKNPYSGGVPPSTGGGGRGYGGYGGGSSNLHAGSSQANPYSNRSSNSGPVQRADMGEMYLPISGLNPYHNRWTIKARVTSKSDIRRWSNARGEGHLFSVDLLDEEGSEIRGTFFKETCDRWYEFLQPQRVYSFSGGRIKVANKQYSALNSQYEITFDAQTEINELGDDNRIQNMTFSFVKLSQMEEMPPNTTLDTIAVVKSFEDYAVINTKMGKELEKRNMTLVDDSCTEIAITLWGASAKENDAQWQGCPVVAFKGVKLSEFNGRSLSALNSSTLIANPDIPEAGELRRWFESMGNASSFKNMSTGGGGGGGRDDAGRKDFTQRYTLESISERGLGHGDKPDWATVKTTISFIKLDSDKPPWYTACPSEGCNKKVTETMEGGWQCEKCNRTYPECRRRYILNLTVSDHTGKAWVTAFNDVALPLLNGKTADELNELKENGHEAAYDDVFQEACFKTFLMTLRVKAEMVQDEMRIKNTIQRMSPIDLPTENQALLSAIAKYN